MEWHKSNKPEPKNRKNEQVLKAEAEISSFLDGIDDCVSHECGDQYEANKIAVRYRQAVNNLEVGGDMYIAQRHNRIYMVKGQR